MALPVEDNILVECVACQYALNQPQSMACVKARRNMKHGLLLWFSAAMLRPATPKKTDMRHLFSLENLVAC